MDCAEQRRTASEKMTDDDVFRVEERPNLAVFIISMIEPEDKAGMISCL